MDRCPICKSPVKAENLVRHLNGTHPRHPDTPAFVEKLKAGGRTATRKASRAPLRIRRWQIVLAVGIGAIVLVGYVVAPYFDPYRNFGPDSCINEISVPNSPPYHLHPYLTIDVVGTPHPIPGQIGITSTCTHPIHTHSGSDATGAAQLHVETPIVHAFYLRDFFHVWGDQPFNQNQILQHVANSTYRVSMTVDGVSSPAYGNLVLAEGQQIVITYGP